ncbi:MAG: MAPEG family protein [Rhizomicrobium sp.]
MSLSLWMLLAFACWTLLVLLAGVGVMRWLLIFGGRAALTSFPGDTVHGSPAYRRAMRAHANCVENLPVFAAIVLVAAFAQRLTHSMDVLAAVVMAGRVVQTSVHMLLPETNRTVAVRFAFFMVQFGAMAAMAALTAAA